MDPHPKSVPSPPPDAVIFSSPPRESLGDFCIERSSSVLPGTGSLPANYGTTLEQLLLDSCLQFKMSKSISVAEVANHTTAENGFFIIVDDGVYDVTGMYIVQAH